MLIMHPFVSWCNYPSSRDVNIRYIKVFIIINSSIYYNLILLIYSSSIFVLRILVNLPRIYRWCLYWELGKVIWCIVIWCIYTVTVVVFVFTGYTPMSIGVNPGYIILVMYPFMCFIVIINPIIWFWSWCKYRFSWDANFRYIKILIIINNLK